MYNKSTQYYVKALVIAGFMFIISFLLMKTIMGYLETQDYFSPGLQTMAAIALLQFSLLVLNALMVGAWDKWEQYIFVPFPVILGISIVTFPINYAYAMVIAILTYLIMAYDIFLASQLKRQMLVFNPRLVLKFSAKGILLAFSITAAALVILNARNLPDVNVGQKAGHLVDKYFANVLNDSINSEIQNFTGETENLSLLGMDPITTQQLIRDDILSPEISLKETVSLEVNKLVEPYKRFVNPLFAVIVFGLMQFIGTITFFIYVFLINGIFLIAKASGLYHIEKVPAEREILRF